jgi:tetratricopeptide (TPR) repeat protein
MTMLLADNKAADAAALAEATLARLPEDKKKDEPLQFALGKAQMMSGSKDTGRKTLVALMQSSESSLILNDCAYELADAGEALEPADEATKKALGKMDDESKEWTLNEKPEVLIGQSNLIVATWDTMGWIFFREGKLDQAEDYLRAAWRNRQDATVGEHLGEVLEAKGSKSAALNVYELALASIPQYDALGVKKKAPGNVELKLMAKAEALKKTGAKSSVGDAKDDLLKIRTISLGPAKGLNGTAEYRMLLSEGKVERVEAAGTKVVEGGPERLKTANLSGFWPAGSHAKLVRNGMLNCHSGVCELVLVP